MAEAEGDRDEAGLDAFLEKFRGSERYAGAFSPERWEEEFEKIPMFMKNAPSEIDPKQNPDLACLQSIIFDEEQTLEEQAKTYKNEGNDYFKEKDYKKAVISYTEGLNKKCSDQELNVVLHTNRAAAQFHLGNCRSALNDAIAARKIKPSHLKAILRGALCYLELKRFSEALTWCEEGLKIDPKEKKLLETRAKADRLKRTEERDLRKARLQEKKEQSQKDALFKVIKDRNIKLSPVSSKDDNITSGGLTEMSLDGFASESSTGAKVCLHENGSLSWPVLFLYPEHGQSDLISAFHEESRFIEHLMAMFEELPPWDTERKYYPGELERLQDILEALFVIELNRKKQELPVGSISYRDITDYYIDPLTLYYEEEETEAIYQICTQSTLLQALQHPRYVVKAGTPTFLVLVKHVPFSKNYFLGKKVHRL